MHNIVCIKQVPDTREVRLDPKTGNLIREGVPSIINPEDKNAIEEALRLKDEFGGTVTVITMGPPQAEEALREALAMGADKAVLIGDRAFAGADTGATSYTLGCAINKLGKYDLILCGREAIDGNTAQVGPQLGEILGLPQITYVRKVVIRKNIIEAERALEDGYEVVSTQLPVLLTVVKECNEPRIAAVADIIEAYREKEVIAWSAKDVDGDKARIGLNGSWTRIRKAAAVKPQKGKVQILEGSVGDVTKTLVAEFNKRNLL